MPEREDEIASVAVKLAQAIADNQPAFVDDYARKLARLFQEAANAGS